MHFLLDRLSGAKQQKHNEKMIRLNVQNDGHNGLIEGAQSSERLIYSRLVSL